MSIRGLSARQETGDVSIGLLGSLVTKQFLRQTKWCVLLAQPPNATAAKMGSARRRRLYRQGLARRS